MPVRDRDRSAKTLAAMLKLQQDRTITVGIHAREGGASHDEADVTVAELGSWHEFGLGVPQRSFVRGWYDESQREIATVLKARMAAVARGADPDQQLEVAALQFESSMKERISDHIPPPLSPSTIAAKGSSTPLIDSGQLRNAIRARVKKV